MYGKTFRSKNSSYFYPQRAWMNILFAIMLLFLIIINLISYKQIQNLVSGTLLVYHTYDVMQASNKVFINHLNAVTVSRGFFLTGDESLLINMSNLQNEMDNNLQILLKLTRDNLSQQKRVKHLKVLLDQRNTILAKLIELKKTDKSFVTNAKPLISVGQTITDKVQETIDDIYDEEFSLLQRRNATATVNFRDTMFFVVFMDAISLLLLIIIIVMLNKNLSRFIETEKRRKRAEILLQGIINGSNDYITVVDTNLKYIAFNEGFEEEFKRIFGKKPMIGMSVRESLKLFPAAIEQMLSLWNRALTGDEFTILGRFGNPNLASEQYEVTYNPIYDEQKQLIGASHVARNVTKRIEQEKSLKIAKADIEKSYRDLKKHDHEISLINEMNSSLQAASSIEDIMLMVKNYCTQLLNFTRGVMYIINTSRNYLEAKSVWNDPQITDQVILPDQCWGLRQGKLYKYLPDLQNLPCKHAKINGDIDPYICVPMLAQNNIIGLLYLQIKDYKLLSDEQLHKLVNSNEILIENIAAHISLALANMQLQEALRTRSIRDALTGLYNRTYLEESLYRDFERAKRKNIPLAIVMLDLDHFKSINDNYSHEAGDLVLIEFGKLLRKSIRKSDIAFRYGGEEFLMLFYDVNEATALEKCEKIRQGIESLTVFLGNNSISSISASFGIAMFPEDSTDWNFLISAADQALYQSKKTGRNKISLFKDLNQNRKS